MKLFILLLFFSFGFGETLYLKEVLYLTNSRTSLSNLFKNPSNLRGEVNLTSKFYTSADILKLVNTDDIIIAGRGITVKIVKSYSINKLAEIIKNSGYDLIETKLPENMPDIYLISITNLIEQNILNSFVELCYFQSEYGIITNLIITSKIKIKEIKEEEALYLTDIVDRNAVLNYKRGNINIKMKVKILKKLENNFYLVENYNGKILKARVIYE